MSDSQTPSWLQDVMKDGNEEWVTCHICSKELLMTSGNSIRLPIHFFDNEKCPGSKMREYETERVRDTIVQRLEKEGQ